MKNLKLNKLEQNQLSAHELNNLQGGNTCTCSCYWADKGGSSIKDNSFANYRGNQTSNHGNNEWGLSDDL